MDEFINKNVILKLKNGEQKVGKIPALNSFPNEIVFLPYQKESLFNEKFQTKRQANKSEISDFVEFIDKSEVLDIIKLDSNLKNIRLENGKKLPNLIQFKIKYSEKPGHLGVEYQIEKDSPVFDLGEFPIINGEIVLPMKLTFISYAKEDRNQAFGLMKELHKNGMLTWFDEKDLLPGDFWEEKIEMAIETSDYFIALFSSNTLNKRGYKHREIEYALKQKSKRPHMSRFIIPILLDDCILPRNLEMIHWLKATDKDWLQKLIMTL